MPHRQLSTNGSRAHPCKVERESERCKSRCGCHCSVPWHTTKRRASHWLTRQTDCSHLLAAVRGGVHVQMPALSSNAFAISPRPVQAPSGGSQHGPPVPAQQGTSGPKDLSPLPCKARHDVPLRRTERETRCTAPTPPSAAQCFTRAPKVPTCKCSMIRGGVHPLANGYAHTPDNLTRRPCLPIMLAPIPANNNTSSPPTQTA